MENEDEKKIAKLAEDFIEAFQVATRRVEESYLGNPEFYKYFNKEERDIILGEFILMRAFRSTDANFPDSPPEGIIELARDKIPEGKYIGKRMGMVFDAWREFNEILYTNIELTELRKLGEEIIKMQDIGEEIIKIHNE